MEGKKLIKMWEDEALRNMQKYAMENTEFFNFWHGFRSGMDLMRGLLKSGQIETKDI